MSLIREQREAADKAQSRRASKTPETAPRTRASPNTVRHFAMTELLPKLAIFLIVCLVAMPSLAPPAAAQDDNPPGISLSPRSGIPGTRITVYGQYFPAGKWVDIYYYLDGSDRILVAGSETTTAALSFSVAFDVPASYKGGHKVRAELSATNYTEAVFTVTPGLTVSPAEGPVGASVSVEGLGFGKNEDGIKVYFDGEIVPGAEGIKANAIGSWTKTGIVIPPASGGRHTIRAAGDSNSATATFDVKPGISVAQSSGFPGQSVNMTGNAFATDERHIRILFDGEELVTDIRADDAGHWQEPFEVPELPAGNYTLTADGDPTGKEDFDALSFEIKPGLALSSDQGHVGMNLTVSGRGFAPNEDVVILYDGSEVETARTNDKGTFLAVSFAVPESRHGAQQVTAEDAEGNEATAVFTMESDPPGTPELISPRDEGRAGFVGRVRPRFKWSDVFDDSGVYYRLRISTSANVSATGEFVDEPILTKEGLVGANCTLEKTEALRYGTYYWIVQAVDGAGNAGNWTAPYSFRAGLLPLWAFIVIIVFLVLLGGGLAYFFVVKRRMYY